MQVRKLALLVAMGKRVYVHCTAGINRATLTVVGYLTFVQVRHPPLLSYHSSCQHRGERLINQVHGCCGRDACSWRERVTRWLFSNAIIKQTGDSTGSIPIARPSLVILFAPPCNALQGWSLHDAESFVKSKRPQAHPYIDCWKTSRARLVEGRTEEILNTAAHLYEQRKQVRVQVCLCSLLRTQLPPGH